MQETDEEQGGIIFQDRTGERARTRGLDGRIDRDLEGNLVIP